LFLEVCFDTTPLSSVMQFQIELHVMEFADYFEVRQYRILDPLTREGHTCYCECQHDRICSLALPIHSQGLVGRPQGGNDGKAGPAGRITCLPITNRKRVRRCQDRCQQ
jgi:hypothetical protein